ncbi:MAG: tetratricopeptide repeat protein, partial [Ignavibacteriaceae bacterium]
MRILFFLTFISFSPSSINAYTLNTPESADAVVTKGLEYCYHFKWDKAEDTFRSIIEKHPDSPEGYHYLSSVYFWYYLSSNDEADLKNFKKYSDLAIDKAKELLEENENNAELLYLLGSNYNYRTVAFAKAENYLDAVWAAQKSESYLSDCLESDSSLIDAYLGLGLYNFAVANIPSGFRWALNLAGISGEESTGLRYIKIAADKGKLARVEAQYYLSQILTEVIMDYETASGYLTNLIKKYPDNLLFNYSYAAVEMKKRKLDEAEKILSKITRREEEKFTQIISFSNFLLGDIHFRRNQFDEARKHYQDFLNSANDKDYTGIASYRLALAFEITGDRNTARKYFSLSKNGNMDIEDDIFARRKGEVYSKRTISLSELEVIKAGNLIESAKYSEAINSLTNLLSEIKTERIKAEIYLLMSEVSFQLKRFIESADYALNAVKINPSDESWIKPFG